MDSLQRGTPGGIPGYPNGTVFSREPRKLAAVTPMEASLTPWRAHEHNGVRDVIGCAG